MLRSLTPRLKAELWRRFGTPEHPAEWDGQVYGGGKLSQRFWEYFIAIELLDLDEDSVVLDLGGGSPKTGVGFFSAILAEHARRVIVMDPFAGEGQGQGPRSVRWNVELLRENATYESLAALLRARTEITHISCVSVFEHVEPAVREGMIRAINEFFEGRSFVTTFEYHSGNRFFDQQLTARTASDLVKPLRRFYLDRFEASPVWAENAYDADPKFRLKGRRFFWQRPRLSPSFVPLWYPVALRFVRTD